MDNTDVVWLTGQARRSDRDNEFENGSAALGRKQRGCITVGVCAKGIKKELNTLDEADFVRDVAKSSSHQLSHFEIALAGGSGRKPIK